MDNEELLYLSVEHEVLPVNFDNFDFLVDMDVIDDGNTEISFDVMGDAIDYNMAINKPKINGTTLIGNYDEIDPTVPKWAKNNTKPNYSANEVGAVDIDNNLTMAEIEAIVNAVFS